MNPEVYSNYSILLVEDDESLGSSLSERLSLEPYSVTWVQSVKSAIDELEKSKFDLCVLDVGLPDGSGFNVAREVKTNGNTPVVFLTAMNSAEHRLEGFEIGCDDFIPKPFHLKEFLLRIKKVINASIERISKVSTKTNQIKLNKDLLSAVLPDGKIAEFSSSDFELLCLLIEQSPKVVTRQSAFTSVFKGQGPATRTVDNSIVRIRTLLGEWARGNLKTIRGVGYQWVTKE